MLYKIQQPYQKYVNKANLKRKDEKSPGGKTEQTLKARMLRAQTLKLYKKYCSHDEACLPSWISEC